MNLPLPVSLWAALPCSNSLTKGFLVASDAQCQSPLVPPHYSSSSTHNQMMLFACECAMRVLLLTCSPQQKPCKTSTLPVMPQPHSREQIALSCRGTPMPKVSGGPICNSLISTPLWLISLTNLPCASHWKQPRDNNSRYGLTYGIPGVIKLSDNRINLSHGLGIKSESVSCCGFLFISVLLNCISLPPTKSACCLQL